MTSGPFPVSEAYRPIDMIMFRAAGERIVERQDRRDMGIIFEDEDALSGDWELLDFYRNFGLHDSIVTVEADRESIMAEWNGRYQRIAPTVRFVGELLMPTIDVAEERLSDRSTILRSVVVFPMKGIVDTLAGADQDEMETVVLKGWLPLGGIQSIGRLQGISGFIGTDHS